MFANISLLKSDITNTHIRQSQHCNHVLIKQWEEEYHMSRVRDHDDKFTYRRTDLGEAIIPSDVELKRYLMDIHHNHLTAGHPGRDETIKVLHQHYFWLGLAK